MNGNNKGSVMLTLFAFLALGCVSPRGLSVIDSSEAQRGTWAKRRQYFLTSEQPLIRVYGYGGQEVTVQLREATRGLVGRMVAKIDKAKIEKGERIITFNERFGQMVPVERQTMRWTTHDLLIPLRELPPGSYEVHLTSGDGRNERQIFHVREAGF